MTPNVRTDRFADYNLEPSQCAEWIVEQSSCLSVHTVAAFGWMARGGINTGGAEFHRQEMVDQIEKIRQLLNIMEERLSPAIATTTEETV
jgi:hypothetical protein